MIKTSVAGVSKPNMIVLNKNSVRPMITTKSGGGTVTTTTAAGLQNFLHTKFAKIVVAPQSNQKIISASSLMNTTSTADASGVPTTTTKYLSSGKKIEIINSSIIRSGSIAGGEHKYTPIIINVDPSKGQSFKMLKQPGEMAVSTTTGKIVHLGQKATSSMGGGGGAPTPNIVIKPNILKQVTLSQSHMPKPKPAILSRGNLTVKKIYNLPPRGDNN